MIFLGDAAKTRNNSKYVGREDGAVEHAFKINLRGIIDLLSQHLYGSPRVYLRELLQNGVDAIRAREGPEHDAKGEIKLEVVGGKGGKPPTLIFIDDGVGLTEEEVHRFLATIGESSKRGEYFDRPIDFLGRFGIGLLSCFVVSDEIVVITRSSRSAEAKTIEWRGRADGTYLIRTLDHEIEAGTQVYLTAKKGSEEYFEFETVADLAKHYGALLPYPIRVVAGEWSKVVNDEQPPWRRRFRDEADRVETLLEYGRETFGEEFLDAIPLRAEAGKVDGVAFVLAYSPGPGSRKTHRVYLKNMLLSEDAEGLLPDWAFFVKCVVNADALRPTASRESFYEDETLEQTREALGDSLRDYLVSIARRDPIRLQRLIALHSLSIKALAIQDDEFYRMFIDWIPFETTTGEMTFGEYRKDNDVVRYSPNLDQFRQLARVAAAQGLCVLNAAYVYNLELIEKYPHVFPESSIEAVDPAALARTFEDLDLEDREQSFDLVRLADVVLQPFKCASEIKAFDPADLPCLYSTDADADLLRSVEQSKDVADSLWSGVLDDLTRERGESSYAQLCFNFKNPLVKKLCKLRDKGLLRNAIEMLYVQSLLLGHHPLSAKEMALLNQGLLGLIEFGVSARGEGRP